MKKAKLSKWVFVALAFIAFGTYSHAQITVTLQVNQTAQLVTDAGLDQTICPWDSATLGAVPPETGGTAPFTYAWSPTTGVSNPTAANPMANPGTTQDYVLTIMDANNCSSLDTVTITVDTCVGIQENHWAAELKVIPNPNEGNFTLRLFTTETADAVVLNLVDPFGKLVYNREIGTVSGTYETRVNLNTLARGIYFLHISSANRTVSRKVVIQ